MSFPKVAITVGKLSLPPSYFIADQVDVLGSDGVTVHCLKFVSADRLPSTTTVTTTLPAAIAALWRSRPELVHQHWATWSTMGRLAAAAFQIPFVVSVHGYDAFLPRTPGPLGTVIDAVKRTERNAALRAADLVVVNSDFMRNRVVALDVPDSKVVLHRHAVDVRRFRPSDERVGSNALYVGRLSPEKGPDLLLQALAEVEPDKRPHLDIIGDGAMRESLEQFALANQLPVTFHGRRNQDAVLAAMQTALFVVCPSRSQTSQVEASGIVPLEAQACGTPVLVTRAGGLPEGVEPGARRFTPRDEARDLADAMVQFADAAPSLRTAARDYVLANHSLDVWAEQLANLYGAAFMQRNVTPPLDTDSASPNDLVPATTPHDVNDSTSPTRES